MYVDTLQLNRAFEVRDAGFVAVACEVDETQEGVGRVSGDDDVLVGVLEVGVDGGRGVGFIEEGLEVVRLDGVGKGFGKGVGAERGNGSGVFGLSWTEGDVC